MRGRGVTRTEAVEVTCPTCDARPQHPCTGSTGQQRISMHADRYKAAERAAGATEPKPVQHWYKPPAPLTDEQKAEQLERNRRGIAEARERLARARGWR